MDSLNDWENEITDFHSDQSLKARVWSSAILIKWDDVTRYLYCKSKQFAFYRFIFFFRIFKQTNPILFCPFLLSTKEILLNKGHFPKVCFAGFRDLFRVSWVLIVAVFITLKPKHAQYKPQTYSMETPAIIKILKECLDPCSLRG